MGLVMGVPKNPRKMDVHDFVLKIETHGDLGIPHDLRNLPMGDLLGWYVHCPKDAAIQGPQDDCELLHQLQ